MKIDDKALEEFQKLYEEQFGERLSKDDAFQQAHKLLQLVKLVYKPIPKNNQEAPIVKIDLSKQENKNDFYLVEELANKLRVNPMTIYRYIKAGKLTAYKIGKEYRIDQKEFDTFLKQVSTQ